MLLASSCLSLLRPVAQAGLPVLLKGKGAGQRPAVRKATATFGGGSGGNELKACAGEAAPFEAQGKQAV